MSYMGTVDSSYRFLEEKVVDLLNYYGIPVTDNFKYKMMSQIENLLVNQLAQIIPKELNIKYKGEIIKGKLRTYVDGTQTQGLFMNRGLLNKEEFYPESWLDILLEFGDRFIYCRDGGYIYNGIAKDMAEYLDDHDCSHIVYDMLAGITDVPSTEGETVKIFDMFIRKAKKITLMKYTIDMELELDVELSNDLWAFMYVKKVNHTDGSKVSNTMQKLIEEKAKYHNIIYEDLLYRCEHGFNLITAIQMGRAESNKYGFTYSESFYTHFLKYIQYLVNKEKQNGEQT